MNWELDIPAGRSPRKQSQSPRSISLSLNKESQKIRKPLTAAAPPPHRRPPVIIYDVTPEVIHTDPTQFMNVVQRLTGASSSSSAPSSIGGELGTMGADMGIINEGHVRTRAGDQELVIHHPLPAASSSLSCLPSGSNLIGDQSNDIRRRSFSVAIPPDNIVSPDMDTFNDFFDF